MKSKTITKLFDNKQIKLHKIICLLLFFILFISGCKSDTTKDVKIKDIAAWLNEIIPDTIKEDINLPSTHPEHGGVITWKSFNPSVISDSGEILIDSSIEEVMLEYTIEFKDNSFTYYIVINVVGVSIDNIGDLFWSQFSKVISRDYKVTDSYMDYYTVKWTSSNESIFSNTGKYTAPFMDTTITINYEVSSNDGLEKKQYSKEIIVIGMNSSQKEEYIKEKIKNYFNNNFVIKEEVLLPTSIDINGVKLKWEDPNKKTVTKLEDVSTNIIPKVGVFLTCTVNTSNETFTFEMLFQSVEANEETNFRIIKSVELVKEMKVGWNLGNTFDSPNETAWGNPKTTKQMIDEVKKAGFNVIRFPVTWEGHFDPITYKIDEAWFNRVQEVINYIIDEDTFVILNMHHERWNSTSYNNQTKASLIMEKLWTQIGTRFKDYDEHLIFEGMNEPRIYEGTDSVQWSGTAESFAVINHLNNVFVNTIRNLDGNNKYRHLMITTNGAGTSDAILSNLSVMNDQYVIVSVHAYTPYDFAHDKTTVTTWSKTNTSQTKAIDDVFARLNKYFISKGIPVIMGEFSSRDKNNLSSRLEWLDYYLDKANSLGIPCVWWDTGQEQTIENMTFSIFNRRKLTWLFPEIVEMLVNKTK